MWSVFYCYKGESSAIFAWRIRTTFRHTEPLQKAKYPFLANYKSKAIRHHFVIARFWICKIVAIYFMDTSRFRAQYDESLRRHCECDSTKQSIFDFVDTSLRLSNDEVFIFLDCHESANADSRNDDSGA